MLTALFALFLLLILGTMARPALVPARTILTAPLLAFALVAGCAPAQEAEVQRIREQAEQGVAKAQFNLGVRYDNGRGVPQDYAEAAKWYRRAAEQGHASAQYNLGVMYSIGQGVPQNNREAYIWFSLAAASGNQKAAEYREDDARKLSPAQLSSAQAEAARRQAEIQDRIQDGTGN